MALKRKITLAAVALALLAVIVLAVESYRYHQARQFNQAIAAADYQQAQQHSSDYGRFAHAFLQQQDDHFEDAVQSYAEVLRSDTPALHESTSYNLANLYLQRGMAMLADNQHDLATPLIQLAKENYRAIMRRDSDHWDAKYNLERALALLPDVAEEETAEENNPERSSRAIAAMKTRRELP